MILKRDFIENKIKSMYVTVADMCKKHNMETRTISRFMKEDTDFKLSTLDVLCKALECSILDVTGIDYSKRKKTYSMQSSVSSSATTVCEPELQYNLQNRKDKLERDHYKQMYEAVNEEYAALVEINKSLMAQIERMKSTK